MSYRGQINHGVVIVGWDDNFAASNFSTTPSRNGAWIVRNSWGTEYGQGGYFYLSYEDKTIDSFAMAAEAVPTYAYDYNYQYDGGAFNNYYYDPDNCSAVKGANIFTTKASGNVEYITAASFITYDVNYNYNVSVYKNLTDGNNPESGTLVSTVSGTTSFVGSYTVDLPQAVAMNPGETFSVVVTLVNPIGGYAAIGAEYEYSGSRYTFYTDAQAGQSHLWLSGYGWLDLGVEEGCNLRIKAFTSAENKGIPAPTPGYNGLAQAADGNWYYFVDGWADLTYTGLAMLGTDWWMVVNGMIDFSYNGLVFFNNDWWYITDGRLDSTYTGLAFVNDAWWYVANGRIDFAYNGLAFANDAWWCVKEGRVDFDYNGLLFYSDAWWYLEGGRVNFGYTGLAFVNDSWWYVVEGKIDFGFTGLFFYNNDWWYVESGMINFGYTGLVLFADSWWYVVEGKIDFSYTGLAFVNDAWWYVQGGVIDFSYNGMAFHDNKWWYVAGARIDFTYTGLCFFNNEWYYMANGEWIPTYNGTAVGPDGNTYNVVDGKVVF